MEQRSEEWHSARIGKVTASRIADVMAIGKGGAPSVTRNKYKAQLICERLTGCKTEGYINAEMQHGIDQEENARNAYEFLRDANVELVGFIQHPSIVMSGASPDGLIGGEGLVEFKCPNSTTHLETILTKEIDGKYIKQMQWQMACTNRQWCDFASYDPKMPPNLQLFVKRIYRDNDFIAEIETAVIEFLAGIETAIQILDAA